jgi:hypothetical protein
MTREPVGHEWLQGFGAHFDEQFPEPPLSSPIINRTQDGTVIVSDAAGNSVSGRTLKEAQANYERARA